MVLRSGVIIPFQFRDIKKLLMIGVPEENRDVNVWDIKNVVRAAFGVYHFEFRNRKIGFNIPEEMILHYLGQRHDLTNFVIEILQVFDKNITPHRSYCTTCSGGIMTKPQDSIEYCRSNPSAAGSHTPTHILEDNGVSQPQQTVMKMRRLYSTDRDLTIVSGNVETTQQSIGSKAPSTLPQPPLSPVDNFQLESKAIFDVHRANVNDEDINDDDDADLSSNGAFPETTQASTTPIAPPGASLHHMDYESEKNLQQELHLSRFHHDLLMQQQQQQQQQQQEQQHHQDAQQQQQHALEQHQFHQQQTLQTLRFHQAQQHLQQQQQHHHQQQQATMENLMRETTANSLRQRKERMSKKQKEIYVDFLEQHPIISKVRRNDPIIDGHWTKLADILNSVPQGAVKHVGEWKQTFDNWRYRVFLYARLNSKITGESALNPRNFKPLTQTDKRAYHMWIRNPDTAPPDLDKMRNGFANLEEASQPE